MTKKKRPLISVDYICYVCGKRIKNKEYYAVGKNFKGLNLYRHVRCSPLKLSKSERKIRKYWTKNPSTIVHKNKQKKSRQQKKIDLEKEY